MSWQGSCSRHGHKQHRGQPHFHSPLHKPYPFLGATIHQLCRQTRGTEQNSSLFARISINPQEKNQHFLTEVVFLKRNGIFKKKTHLFYTKFLQGLLLFQTKEIEELHMALPHIIATTNPCGCGKNQQIA